MIPLVRTRLQAEIHPNFQGQNKIDFEKELLLNQRRIQLGEIEKHVFDSKRWGPAKELLKVETNDKCAYCEAPTSMVAYGDVEHYRPKSIYWWLAYNYDNYLVSCQLCNQQFKKDKFPIKNAIMKGPKLRRNITEAIITAMAGTIAPDPFDQLQIDDFIKLHQKERPLLLNPYFDNPAEFFAWRADVIPGEVRVELIPLSGNPEAKAFCDAAIECYGLNRKELCNLRGFIYNLYQTFKDTLKDPGISQQTKTKTQQAIDGMKAANAPFAGMIRYFDSLP